MRDYTDHNIIIEDALWSTINSLPSFLKVGKPKQSLKDKKRVARLIEGIVLNEEHLSFLSTIAEETASELYKQVSDVKPLLQQDATAEERCSYAQNLVTAFSNAMNRVLPAIVNLDPALDEGEILFRTPDVYEFEEPKSKDGKLMLGEFRNGRMLVNDRFSSFYNQCIGINVSDDALKNTSVFYQILTTAHEAGHAIEDYIRTRTGAGLPALPHMLDAIERSRYSIESDENFAAYQATPTEQYAEFFGHSVMVSFIEKLFEEGGVDSPEIETKLERILKESLEAIEKTTRRTKLTDEGVQIAREALMAQPVQELS